MSAAGRGGVTGADHVFEAEVVTVEVMWQGEGGAGGEGRVVRDRVECESAGCNMEEWFVSRIKQDNY